MGDKLEYLEEKNRYRRLYSLYYHFRQVDMTPPEHSKPYKIYDVPRQANARGDSNAFTLVADFDNFAQPLYI